MARRENGVTDALIVLTVRICERGARAPEVVLERLLGITDLPNELVVRERRKMGMAPRMRTDLDKPIRGKLSELRPIKRLQLVNLRDARELRNLQRSAALCEISAHKDRARDSQRAENRQHVRHTGIAVVERHMKEAPIRRTPQKLLAGAPTVTAVDEPLQLSFDIGDTKREHVVPGV
jgi:hypothetical protein